MNAQREVSSSPGVKAHRSTTLSRFLTDELSKLEWLMTDVGRSMQRENGTRKARDGGQISSS
jgi:hypothetical protein